MREGWEIKKLGEVCELSAGGDVPKDNFSEIKTEKYKIPIYANGERNDGLYGFTSIAKVTKPSITVSARGTIGYSVKRVEAFFPIVRLIVVTPTNLKELDLDYLDYALKKIDFKHSGSSIPQLTVPMIRDYEIPLPPLPEQHRIVSILDETFAAIAKAKANAEQNLINAKELFESYLQGVFEDKGGGWEEKTLGELFEIGSSKRIMEKDWTIDGVPFYGGKEIVKLAKFGFVISNSYISEEKYNEYASKYDMPQRGDILITARGTIGIGYIVKKGDKFYYKDGNIISMRAKVPTNPEFILYALKSNVIYDQFKKLTGATVSHLPIEKAKLLVLKVPNFSTQNIVVEKIQEIEAETKKLETIYQQKINDLEELKKSILKKAFAGELKTEKAIMA